MRDRDRLSYASLEESQNKKHIEEKPTIIMTSKSTSLDRIIALTENQKATAWLPVIKEKEGGVLSSKYLGKSYLLPEEYPCCLNCGKPMQLFLQLNLDTLPPEHRTESNNGLLQLFYCISTKPHCEWECDANAAFESQPGYGKLIRIV